MYWGYAQGALNTLLSVLLTDTKTFGIGWVGLCEPQGSILVKSLLPNPSNPSNPSLMASGRSSQYHPVSGSLQNEMENSNYPPEQRPDDETAVFDHFQHREGAQYGLFQNQNSGFNRATTASRNQHPVYNRVPVHTAYEQYGSRQYRPSVRNDGTSNSRAGMTSGGNVPSLYPAFVGHDRSNKTHRTDGHYRSTEMPQPSRQQNTFSHESSYGGVYKNTYNSQANTIAGHQQSPYLLPGQEPHDVNNPPSAFRPGPAAVNHRNTIAVPHPPPSHRTKAKQRNVSSGSSNEDEEPKQAAKKVAPKKIQNPPRTKCATLRKTINKHGETKTVDGRLMWLDPNEPAHKKWKPAIAMDDIRKYILRQQENEAQALGCSFLNPDEPGGEPYGDTAFFYPHRNFGKDREQRPDILFTIDETDNNNPQPIYDPGWMMYDPVRREISDSGTVIVLNPADNPIVNWREIPLCISPHMDGSKMEYMRRMNKAIRQQDLWARMPRRYWQKPGDPSTLRDISSENTMVNMPSKRFRQKAGCLVWTERGGSTEIEVGLKQLLNRTEVGRQCIAANSMRGFGRDLNGAEQLEIKRGNTDGRYLNKAGSRAVDEKTRNERRAKEDKRIAKAQRAEAAALPAAPMPTLSAASKPVKSRKRSRREEEDDGADLERSSSSPEQRPSKRFRPSTKQYSGLVEQDHLENERMARFQQAEAPSLLETPSQVLPAVPTGKDAASQPVITRKRHRRDDEEDSFGLTRDNVLVEQRPIKRYRRTRKHNGNLAEDNDLAIFDHPQSFVEDSTSAQGEQGRESTSKKPSQGVGTQVSRESSNWQGGEHGDGENSAPDAATDDDDDYDGDNDEYISDPDQEPRSVTETQYIYNEHEANDNWHLNTAKDGDEGHEPELTPQDPNNDLFGTKNALAKESDLETHRRKVRDLLDEDQETYASALSRRRTAPANPKYPTRIDPLNPTSSPSPNFSETRPSTPREAASIAVAILPTKIIFWEWTGQTVPQPPRANSYGAQFRELHQAFASWWGENRSGEELPVLAGVEHWGNGVGEWEAVRKDAVYYEAFKKGHRAPRDRWGMLMDVPGPLLEKFSDF
ncbi:hypothetical protein BDR22DRAFT_547484 [Usnea florida]